MFDLNRMYLDVFEHLGVEVECKPQGLPAFKTLVLIKEPENVYEVGSSQVIGQIAEITIKFADLKMPMVGDMFFVENKKYRICEKPLMHSSDLMWKFKAMLVGK